MTPEELALYNTENFKAQFKKEARANTESGESVAGSYEFIAKLLCHPISDGRVRMLWLVLAPYAVTILKQSRENAIFMVKTYIEECDKLKPCPKAISLVEQFVDYAAQIDLKPPKLVTIEANDPDLWVIITKAIQE